MTHALTAAIAFLLGLLAGVLLRDAAAHDDSLASWRMGVSV